MKTTTTVAVSFEAGHTVITDPYCEAPHHGHSWKISITSDGLADHGELLAALQSVIGEFADRDLNDMLPGVVTSPVGLGLYVRERLALEWHRLTRVQVEMGPHITSTIEWEIR